VRISSGKIKIMGRNFQRNLRLGLNHVLNVNLFYFIISTKSHKEVSIWSVSLSFPIQYEVFLSGNMPRVEYASR